MATSWYDKNKELKEEDQAPQRAADAAAQAQRDWANVQQGGYNVTPEDVARVSRINQGLELGRKQFSEDPDVQRLQQIREQQAKGYATPELAALRGLSRNEIDANREKTLQVLRSNLGRGGVGGARSAAMIGQADTGLQKAAGDTERKMLLDESEQQRKGVEGLQDFIFRKKLGEAGYGIGTAQLGSADEAAKAARAANSGSAGGTLFICTALRNYGLMTKQESKDMFKVFKAGMFKRADFGVWYLCWGLKFVVYAMENGFDFSSIKKAFVDDVLKCYEQKGPDAAVQLYIETTMDLICEIFPEARNERVLKTGILKSILSYPKIMANRIAMEWIFITSVSKFVKLN